MHCSAECPGPVAGRPHSPYCLCGRLGDRLRELAGRPPAGHAALWHLDCRERSASGPKTGSLRGAGECAVSCGGARPASMDITADDCGGEAPQAEERNRQPWGSAMRTVRTVPSVLHKLGARLRSSIGPRSSIVVSRPSRRQPITTTRCWTTRCASGWRIAFLLPLVPFRVASLDPLVGRELARPHPQAPLTEVRHRRLDGGSGWRGARGGHGVPRPSMGCAGASQAQRFAHVVQCLVAVASRNMSWSAASGAARPMPAW